MRRATTATAIALIALAAACSNNDSDGGALDELRDLGEAVSNAPACTDLFAPGRPTADVLADAEDPGICTHGDEHIITALASVPCTTDPARSVHYTGSATDGTTWGFGIAGGTWAALPEGQDAPDFDVC